MMTLEPISVEGLDCLVNSYLSLLQRDLGEYQYAFWDTWAFCYNKTDNHKIGHAINLPMSIYLDNIQQYYLSDMEELFFDNWEVFRQSALESLRDQVPIVVCVDTFYCSWYDNYGKTHSKHTFLLMDYVDSVWKVIDTMPRRININFTDEDLRKGIFWARKVVFLRRNGEKNLSQFLLHTLKRKEEKKEQYYLEQFVHDFIEVDLEEELEFGTYVWSVPILRNIRRNYYSRKQFLEYAEFLKKQEDVVFVEYITDLFHPIISEWAVVMNVFYKMQISRKINKKDKIQECLETIAIKEREAIYKVTEVLHNREILKDYSTGGNREFFQINLDFNEYSHFFETKDFIRKTEIPTGILWEKDNVRFVFPKVAETNDNCVKCIGQKIAMPDKDIKKIHFIGYATWGNQMTQYQLHYDGEIITRELTITDWCMKPEFMETVLWRGSFIQKGTEIEYFGHIFDVVIPVEEEKKLIHIQLPDCERVILFAIVAEI